MRVTGFDHSTGKVTIEFDNRTRDLIPIEHAYLTVHPTNNAPLKPFPPDLQHLITVFDKQVMRITGWSGIKVGPIESKDNEKSGRYIYRTIFVVRGSDDVVLPPKELTITNFTPQGTAFANLCDQFAGGAELEITLHIALLNKKERVCTRKLTIGKYSTGTHHKQFEFAPQLKKVDVLRGAEHVSKGRYTSAVYSFSNNKSLELPILDCRSMLFENSSEHDLLLRIHENYMTGHIPVIRILSSVQYGIRFLVELRGDEKLPDDPATWILTQDYGSTVMSLPVAFSNDWTNKEQDSAAKEYVVPLSSTNWCLLIGGERWAKIEGAIECAVTEKSWMKFIPADDATASNILSNYQNIAAQELDDDPSWISVTNRASIMTNSDPYVIIQNEAIPNFSLFRTLVPDNLNTNTKGVVP